MSATILSANLPPSSFEPASLPPRSGVGLKTQHVDAILAANDGKGADVGFFEVHAENYMGAGGMPHDQLRRIRERYPVSIHGVGMSIGGAQPIDKDHLARFKAVVDRYEPGMVSEHLAWSTHDDVFYNDLLPLPYTDETLQTVVEHIDEVQSALGRRILIENPSTYVTFVESDWSEFEFMKEIARRSGCGLLFDVNNVFVSATNHGFSPQAYIDAYPTELVQEIHLAGHASDSDDDGNPLLIDAHDRPVCRDVWALYRQTLSRTGPLPSLVEWDNEVPEWEVLEAEAAATEQILGSNRIRPQVA
ncbi:MNIO family bufferin maturase [Salaquimonas pukyongi]|uniref:MNIO family bufferin maturase n=1 Tax=Salaquimonas pukyongi TaxID=2712698 RepID=UPI00096BB309|nr:DUF692 domain-containing protein [Salaquimonas pukyongi]